MLAKEQRCYSSSKMPFYFQTLKGHITVYLLEFNSQLKPTEESITHHGVRGRLNSLRSLKKLSESITVLVSIY